MNTNRLKRNIPLNYIFSFIDRMNMQSCIWVLYLGFMGMSLTQIGILEGLYHATSIICEVPSGAVADLLGRKKTIIAGRICVFISCLLMLFGRDFYVFALSFIIQAFGNNLNSGAQEALVYDSMKLIDKEDDYVSVSAKTNTLVEISQSIATVVGAMIAEYSYAACYITSSVLAAMTLVPLFMMEEPVIEKKNEVASVSELVKNHFKTCFDVLKSDRTLTSLIIFFNVLDVAGTVLFFYSQKYYDTMGLNKIEIGLIMFIVGIMAILGAYLSDKIYKKIGDKIKPIAVLLIVASICGYLLFNLWVSIVCFAVCNFVVACLYPIRSASINKLVPSEQRATLISVDSLVFSLGMIVIFPMIGFIVDLINL